VDLLPGCEAAFDALLPLRAFGQPETGFRCAALAAAGLPDARGTLEPIARPLVDASVFQHPLALVAAAAVHGAGWEGETALAALQAVRDGLRERGVPAGGVRSEIAALTLALLAPDRAAALDRMAAILREWERVHPWITGEDDRPLAALLAVGARDPAETAARCEDIYDGLRREGWWRGGWLQLTSHLLALPGDPARDAIARFQRLHGALRDRAVETRFDWHGEVAAAAMAVAPPAEMARAVAEGIGAQREHPRPPSAGEAFSLACLAALRGRMGERESHWPLLTLQIGASVAGYPGRT